MRVRFFILLFLAFLSCLSYAEAYDIGKLVNNSNITNIAQQLLIAQQLGVQGMQNLTNVSISPQSTPSFQVEVPPPPKITVPESQIRLLALSGFILLFVFAAGKIADFLKSSGNRISKKEAIYAPLAYLLFSTLGVFLYFSSGYWKPPQDTIITNVFYLIAIPAAIMAGVGALVLYSFFKDRLNPTQSLDLSIKIIFAPIFDGLRGYWTALGAAAILAGMSAFSFYSSGGRLSLVTLDFLILSIAVSLYYLYRALTVSGNENKAASIVTMLTILAPSILQSFFKEAVCSILSKIPFGLFSTCPLLQVGSEVTLALAVGATMLLVMPIVPIAYALMVNLLRAIVLAQVLLERERKEADEET
ncbi:MAG: hypothetical protein QW275_02615 [Candidatus Anstonellaceae archaeon]